jgi:tight adherence protein B
MMMIAIICLGGLVFVLSMAILPKSRSASTLDRRNELLEGLSRSGGAASAGSGTQSMATLHSHDYTMSDAMEDLPPIGRALVRLPLGMQMYRRMVQSGNKHRAGPITALAFIALLMGMFGFISYIGILGVVPALLLPVLGLHVFLNRSVTRRNRAFMNGFADAIDMIVRAIKSGNPVNSALRLVAEHSESPVKDEFRLVVDEITYGRPLIDALARMAKRVPEYDVSFFVVVLTVQQETGGNLAEVLGKLSSIIRKRHELFLKVRAITAEGRATAWILGGLPLVLTLVLYKMSPEYIGVLFTNPKGKWFLIGSAFFVISGVVIIRKLSDIKV